MNCSGRFLPWKCCSRRRKPAGRPRKFPAGSIVAAVRAAVAAAREWLQTAAAPPADAEALRELILTDVGWRIKATLGPHYRKAINATGIILHTGLGRAVLPAQALRQISRELSGFSVLQIDVADGQRSRRDERIEELLRLLTGAEAATVVNNNAAATAIVLNTVAAGKEVIVSRGQLVEIGGSFRLPEVMAAAGAKLVEVGTTNKTHLRDYERAISERSAAILRVHPEQLQDRGLHRGSALGGTGSPGPGPRLGRHRRRRRRPAHRFLPVRFREGADAGRVGRRGGRRDHLAAATR